MPDRIRVGIVGAGAVAQFHLASYREVDSIEVVCVSDTDAQTLAMTQRRFGLRGYDDVTKMLRNERLDLACVLTPPATHESITRICAAARVHVLCEKPLALSVDACRRMIDECRRAGVQLCYGASYRYLPALMTAREMILEGALGDILLLREYAVGGRGIENRATLASHHYPSGGPGGSAMGLVDHGVHLIDVFAWLMNSAIVYAAGRGNVTGQLQRPEFAHLEFANGAFGQLLYEDGTYATDLPHEGIFTAGGGWDADGYVAPQAWHAHPGCIHVHGTKGALRIFHYANALYRVSGEGWRQLKIADRPMPGNFAMQMEATASAIREGRPAPVTGEAGAEACRVLNEIYSRRTSSHPNPEQR